MTKCAYHSEVDAVTACAEETLLAKAQVGEFKPNRVIPAEGESGQESLPEIPMTKG